MGGDCVAHENPKRSNHINADQILTRIHEFLYCVHSLELDAGAMSYVCIVELDSRLKTDFAIAFSFHVQ